MPTNDDCPVCNGRKIIFTRDYADCEREEPCPHCSEHEHCASCISLRAENVRLREGLAKVNAHLLKYPAVLGKCYFAGGLLRAEKDVLAEYMQEVMPVFDAALKEPGEKPICGKCGGRCYLTTIPDLFLREDRYPCPECSKEPGDHKS